MNNKIIIAIDAMGGENAPFKNISGVSLFIKKNKKKDDVFFNIFGKEDLIKSELAKHKISSNKYKIFSTSTVVSDEETPSMFLNGAFSPPIASIAIIILLFMI